MASSSWSLLPLALLSLASHSLATPLVGVVLLDSYSFNKTLSGFQYSLVKFDKGYPHGDHHSMWGELARELRDVMEILVAEVRVKEYGDKANLELAARFGFNDREQFPEASLTVMLYIAQASGGFFCCCCCCCCC